MQLARADLAEDDRVQFHFAAGKAFEDAKTYDVSFEHYSLANRLRRAQHGYDADRTSARLRRSRELLTSGFFERRRGYGAKEPDPIFILGLPRLGLDPSRADSREPLRGGGHDGAAGPHLARAESPRHERQRIAIPGVSRLAE
ncbi:MAG: hypothetical protein WDO56_10315 [Gammaproteobacteria bacterium]